MKNILLHKRLYISIEDLRMAGYFAEYILKKGWHFTRWERRLKTYYNQSAFTMGLIVSYARPFTESKEAKKVYLPLLNNFLDEILSNDELIFHRKLLSFRHNVFAHSAGKKYNTTPILLGDFATAIYSEPGFALNKDETETALTLIKKLIKDFDKRRIAIVKEIDKQTPEFS